ncbi:exonuclease [Leptospira idonii]|uniref:Exonuclease n=2 Tax=Leptospira idonii TaxID=1193500 RepID=A0A4R9LZZ1_9LEPT|nr:exonuclease [Leptospira idonii]
MFPASLIRSCFEVFTGIGSGLQNRLYEHGIFDWQDLIHLPSETEKKLEELSFPSFRLLREEIPVLEENYKNKNYLFFAERLPDIELWRLWEEFPHIFCYLDIETTGISEDSIVTVASYFLDGGIHTFQRGKNLEFMLDDMISRLILVSYNGKRFDVPFLEKEFRQKIPNIHLDLMNLLHSMGIKGGLKKSEILLGLERPESVQKIDGKMAPLLWQTYQEFDHKESLDLLVEYNREDTRNLEKILKEVVRRKREVLSSFQNSPGLW